MGLNTTALAATLQHRSKGYLDAISTNIPLFRKLRETKQYKKADGGTQEEWAVEKAQDTSEPSFSGWDTLLIRPQDNVVIATATLKNYYKSIAINGEEMRLNSNGRGHQIFKLLTQKEQNALMSMQQQMNDHFYLDGTGNSGKQITGLAAIISAAPTSGSLFGIDRSTDPYWRNQSVDTAGTAFDVSDGLAVMANDMRKLRQQCGRLKLGGRGKRYPNFIICTEAYARFYEEVMRLTGQRFTSTQTNKTNDVGIGNLFYQGAEIEEDVDMPQDAGSAEQAYFINTNFIELLYHPDANFSIGRLQEQIEQDAFSAKILWMGELISTMPSKLGIHQGLSAPEA